MSQVLTIYNPTGGNVAYMSRDCRVTVPTGESTHELSDSAAERITAFLKSHHPLLKVTPQAAPSAPQSADSDAPKDAPATPKAKTPSRRKNSKADATNDSEASAE